MRTGSLRRHPTAKAASVPTAPAASSQRCRGTSGSAIADRVPATWRDASNQLVSSAGKYMLSSKRVLGDIAFEENAIFSTPADFKLMTTAKGYQVLFIPEQEPNSIDAWKQRVRVVLPDELLTSRC